jgi:pantoate--beta-alanine ligase
MTNTASSVQTFSRIRPFRAELARLRDAGRSVAFVPTMGALHEGHLRLVDRARKEADAVVMSIFVNPLQFGPNEDLTRYPRDIAADTRLADERGVDLLFVPESREMYPGDPSVSVTAGALGEAWEGESRPGHFNGVLTVVAKLFNIVEPDCSVFGQKDLQQLAAVQALVRDLAFPIEIVAEPTVRDDDGLALSSRNRYLSATERLRALSLPGALEAIRAGFHAGERQADALEAMGRKIIDAADDVTCDYLAVVDPDTFQRVETAAPKCAAIGALRVGVTRLIDNLIL